MVEGLEVMTNTNGSSKVKGGNVKGGDVNINIDGKSKEGYYIGSATNVMRLFIAVSLVFGLFIGYLLANQISDYNNLNRRVEILERLAR